MIIMRLRKGIQGPLGKAMLAVLFIALFGGLGFSQLIMRFFGGSVTGVVAVNGVDIPGSRFQRAVAEAEQQLSMIRQRYGQNAEILMKIQGISNNPQETALHTVVQHELINQVADKMNVTLAADYLEARLGNPQFILNRIGHMLPASVFDEKYGINSQALMEFLKTPQMRGVEEQLEQELRRQFALLMVQSGFYTPEFMLESGYKEGMLGKKFSVQTFSLEHFMSKEKAKGVTEEQLKAFYDQQNSATQRYSIPEKRTGIQWTFTPQDYGITVTEEEIQKYYNDNKAARYVDTPVQVKVKEIVFNKLETQGVALLKDEADTTYQQVITNPDSFAEVAKKVSQSDTAKNGGLVDFFKRGTKDKAYEKAALRLKADGDISPVTQLEDGSFVILQRVARKDAVYQPLSKVKDAIVKALTDQKFRIAFSRDADRVVKAENADLLEKFIKEHGGKKTMVGPLEKSEQVLGRRLFILRKEGQALSFVQDGKGAILILDKKTAKRLPELNSIKEQVEKDYFEQKAIKALEKQVAKAREQALQTGKFTELEGGKISSTGFIKVDDTATIEKLSKAGYPAQFMSLDWEGAVITAIRQNEGIVIKLDEIEKVDQKLYEEQKTKVQKQAFERTHQLFAASFIASLYRTATIKVNDQLAQLKDVTL